MSMMLNMVGLLSGGGEKFNYLSFTPEGYAAQESSRSFAGGIVKFRIRFRLPGLQSTYILGYSLTSRYALSYTTINGGTLSTRNSGGGVANLEYSIQEDTWYIFEYESSVAGTVTQRLYDADGVLLKTQNSVIATGALSIYLIGRHGNTQYPVEVGLVELGTVSAPLQHVWEPQTSGTTWTDTGTVGGWNWTLLGIPLPTWESE